MELSKLTFTLKRWFLLVILATVLGAGASIVSSMNAVPTYLAETKVLIGGFITSPNPSSGEIETGASLSETYVALVTTTPVLQGVIDALNLPMTASDLQKLGQQRWTL